MYGHPPSLPDSTPQGLVIRNHQPRYVSSWNILRVLLRALRRSRTSQSCIAQQSYLLFPYRVARILPSTMLCSAHLSKEIFRLPDATIDRPPRYCWIPTYPLGPHFDSHQEPSKARFAARVVVPGRTSRDHISPRVLR